MGTADLKLNVCCRTPESSAGAWNGGMEEGLDGQPHNHPGGWQELCLVGTKKLASTHLSFVVSSCLLSFQHR